MSLIAEGEDLLIFKGPFQPEQFYDCKHIQSWLLHTEETT